MRLIDVDKIGLTDFEIIMCNGNYKEALKMLLNKIDNAPTIEQPEPRWIPVAENMPNEEYCTSWGVQRSRPVLVTVVDGEDVFVDMYGTVNGTWPLLSKVTAWMPLPAPYQEGEKK